MLNAIFISLISAFIYDVIKNAISNIKLSKILKRKSGLSMSDIVTLGSAADMFIMTSIMLVYIFVKDFRPFMLASLACMFVNETCFSSLLKRYIKVKQDIREYTRNNDT